MDIFDEIEKKRRDVFDEVESDRIGDKIFDEVEKELPSLVRTYVKEQTKKFKTLSPKEISDLVDATIASIPTPKPIEKVIEKTVEKRIEVVPQKETKKWAELSQIEELKKIIAELKKRIDDSSNVTVIGGPNLPNYSNENGTFLKAQNGRISWDSAGADATSGIFLLGPDSVEGTWRFYVDGSNLSVQRYESGIWVEKGSFMP